MNTLVAVGAMALVCIVGFIAQFGYYLVMLVKHKPTQRYATYDNFYRTADAATVIIGVVGLLIGFNQDDWTAADWITMSLIAINISLVMACAVLADRQRSGRNATL